MPHLISPEVINEHTGVANREPRSFVLVYFSPPGIFQRYLNKRRKTWLPLPAGAGVAVRIFNSWQSRGRKHRNFIGCTKESHFQTQAAIFLQWHQCYRLTVPGDDIIMYRQPGELKYGLNYRMQRVVSGDEFADGSKHRQEDYYTH